MESAFWLTERFSLTSPIAFAWTNPATDMVSFLVFVSLEVEPCGFWSKAKCSLLWLHKTWLVDRSREDFPRYRAREFVGVVCGVFRRCFWKRGKGEILLVKQAAPLTPRGLDQ